MFLNYQEFLCYLKNHNKLNWYGWHLIHLLTHSTFCSEVLHSQFCCILGDEWGVENIFFTVGRFIIFYLICFITCESLLQSVIITAVLPTLESIELYHTDMLHMWLHTYTHTAHKCAQGHTREWKPLLHLLILLLNNVWKFYCKERHSSPQSYQQAGG